MLNWMTCWLPAIDANLVGNTYPTRKPQIVGEEWEVSHLMVHLTAHIYNATALNLRVYIKPEGGVATETTDEYWRSEYDVESLIYAGHNVYDWLFDLGIQIAPIEIFVKHWGASSYAMSCAVQENRVYLDKMTYENLVR